MANYTYPGVYIQEVPKGPGPVQSASASTCAMVGYTEEGPTNEPTLVTSFPEFTSKFGSFTSDGRLPTSAFAFFQNGGQNLVVVRTVGSGAQTASNYIDEILQDDNVVVSPPADASIVEFDLNLSETPLVPGSITFSFNAINYADDGSGVLRDPQSVDRGTVDYQTGEIVIKPAVAPGQGTLVRTLNYQYANFTFQAKSEGEWGNDLRVIIEGDENSVENNNFTLYNLTVQRKDADGAFVDVEVFSGLQFNEDSNSYIENVVNDSRRGSDLIKVIASSTPVTPATIRDRNTLKTAVSNVAIDGTSKQLDYDLNEAVKVGSFTGEIIVGDQVTLTINDTDANQTTTGFTFKPIRDVVGQSNVKATLTTSAGNTQVLNFNQQSLGTQVTDDFDISPGTNNSIEGTVVINPLTGEWSLTTSASGVNNPTITTVKFEYARANLLKVEDDGLGEIVFVSADADVSLHQNGQNKINYATGDVQVWPVLSANAQLQADRGLTPFGSANGSLIANFTIENNVSQVSTDLEGGSNGLGLARAQVSNPTLAGSEEGLYALNKTDLLLNVCIPDFASSTIVSQDLIDYCETRKDRFAILSIPEGYSYTEAIDYKRNVLLRNSNRASIYYPHVKIIDPVTENEINFPAVGHMAGIYARTDSTRNVSKAPAGTVDGRLSFSTGVEVELTPQQAGFVNTAHINNIVSWPFTGLVAWGARTLEANGDFPYIQMRRLFMFVEKSVFNSTQGFVFESNTAGLRASIKLQIEAFLLSLHRSGHFAGNSPAQSFFVICDSSNNPQTAIDQGQLVVDVGIAPTKPAEFVIFRFQQKTVD